MPLKFALARRPFADGRFPPLGELPRLLNRRIRAQPEAKLHLVDEPRVVQYQGVLLAKRPLVEARQRVHQVHGLSAQVAKDARRPKVTARRQNHAEKRSASSHNRGPNPHRRRSSVMPCGSTRP